MNRFHLFSILFKFYIFDFFLKGYFVFKDFTIVPLFIYFLFHLNQGY